MQLNIDEDTMIKIIEKLNGFYLTKKTLLEEPRLAIPEFKFVIGVFKVQKSQWYPLAKRLEGEGYIRLHGMNPIEIRRPEQ